MVKKITSVYFVAIVLWLFVAVHLVFFFGDFYINYNGLDKITHFLGGFWLAIFFSYLIKRQGWQEPPLFNILGWVALVAIAWEFHEFFASFWIDDLEYKMQSSVADNMSDLFFGLLGATIFLVWRKFLLSMGGKK